jgi:hypothetical protein
MGESAHRAAKPELLHYRPWRGTFRGPLSGVWPIARVALGMMFRRKMFWGLYAIGLLYFLLFFFSQYLFAYIGAQAGDPAAAGRPGPGVVNFLRGWLKLDGSGESYRTYFSYQGPMVMIILALAGSVIVGNDLRFGSLPFYLAKPPSRWHYLLGKGLAVAVFINLMTTLPALVLWVEYALLDESGDALRGRLPLVAGILAYGAVLTVSLSLVLLATAVWLRRTVPLVMVWTTLFVFANRLSGALVDWLAFDRRWRLIDLWNDTYLVGNACLGLPALDPTRQPGWHAAALVLGGVSLLCLSYLVLRIRAVEIVR